MTLRIATPAIVLIVALGAGAAAAHSPRNYPTSPLAALDALDMPGLAPARALMHEMLLDDGPHNRIIIVTEPEIPTRRVLPFFSFRWLGAPSMHRSDRTRCETVYSPFGGRVETCSAPLSRSVTPRAAPRGADLMEELQRRLDAH